MNDLVSVVIPTFGEPLWISRAVDSVLVQNYSPIEIIIVDDNGLSTKNQKLTNEIISKYMREYNNIKYIAHQANLNGAVARNTGIRVAKGKYIGLLDDDDEYLPSKIYDQHKALVTNKRHVSYSSFLLIHDRKIVERKFSDKNRDMAQVLLLNEIEIPSTSLFFTKEAFNKIGGFDESFKRHQDWEFNIRLCREFDYLYIDKVEFVKYVYKRNSPQDPTHFEKQRVFFLNKMDAIIKSNPRKIQKMILGYHYSDIIINFIKKKKLFKAVIWFFKTSEKKYCMYNIIKRLIQSVRKCYK